MLETYRAIAESHDLISEVSMCSRDVEAQRPQGSGASYDCFEMLPVNDADRRVRPLGTSEVEPKAAAATSHPFHFCGMSSYDLSVHTCASGQVWDSRLSRIKRERAPLRLGKGALPQVFNVCDARLERRSFWCLMGCRRARRPIREGDERSRSLITWLKKNQ
jgi:hypothetical protein